MSTNYSVSIFTETNSVIITGRTSCHKHFFLTIEKSEDGKVDFKGDTPLELYTKQIFTGGEWQFFEKQLPSFKYMLGEI